MLQEAEEVYRVSDVVPTLMGGAAVLMSVQGAEGVRYIPLAQLSDMAMSLMVSTVSFVVVSFEGRLQGKQ